MKPVYYLSLMIAVAALVMSCDKVSFQKTKSGLVYKIIPSKSKDSTAKPGDWLKIHFKQTLNGDSVLASTYGKTPTYQQTIADLSTIKYNPVEIFPLLKKGDSAIVIMFVDSLFNKKLGRELPPIFKKGDRIELSFRVIDVFRDEAKFQQDQQAEMQKDMPRQMEEQKKQMAEQSRMIREMAEKERVEAEKSGDAQKQRREIEHYLAARKITAQSTPGGTFVHIDQQGTGAMADSGKYLLVKYAGRVMTNDSTFDAGSYPFQLGVDAVIAGWHDGLKLFKQGGKGSLYIPGYRAYGKTGRQGTVITPNAALIFDVEVLNVGDSMPPMPPQEPGR
jgi:FKBP-type peptidyl-prolyl cis-trans isomerase FkpA